MTQAVPTTPVDVAEVESEIQDKGYIHPCQPALGQRGRYGPSAPSHASSNGRSYWAIGVKPRPRIAHHRPRRRRSGKACVRQRNFQGLRRNILTNDYWNDVRINRQTTEFSVRSFSELIIQIDELEKIDNKTTLNITCIKIYRINITHFQSIPKFFFPDGSTQFTEKLLLLQ